MGRGLCHRWAPEKRRVRLGDLPPDQPSPPTRAATVRAAAIPAKFAIDPPLTSSPMPSAGYPIISLIQRMHSSSISDAALPLRQPVTLLVYAAAIMLPIAATGVPGEET